MIVRKHLDFRVIIKVAWKRISLLLLVSTLVTVAYKHFNNPALAVDSLPASVLGVALAILIGFRINSAYERWWEARKIWGALVNDSRSIARQALTFFAGDVQVKTNEQRKFIYRQLAFVYALKNHLRRQVNNDELNQFLTAGEFEKLTNGVQNIPNTILLLHATHLKELRGKNIVEDFRHMSMDARLSSLSDSMGACERIKNTVFPRQYSYYTTLFVALYSYLLPFVFVSKTGWATVPFTIIIGFIFFALDSIARGVENPFENNYNDTPMSSLCRTIEINLKQMLEEREIPEAIIPVNGFLF